MPDQLASLWPSVNPLAPFLLTAGMDVDSLPATGCMPGAGAAGPGFSSLLQGSLAASLLASQLKASATASLARSIKLPGARPPAKHKRKDPIATLQKQVEALTANMRRLSSANEQLQKRERVLDIIIKAAGHMETFIERARASKASAGPPSTDAASSPASPSAASSPSSPTAPSSPTGPSPPSSPPPPAAPAPSLWPGAPAPPAPLPPHVANMTPGELITLYKANLQRASHWVLRAEAAGPDSPDAAAINAHLRDINDSTFQAVFTAGLCQPRLIPQVRTELLKQAPADFDEEEHWLAMVQATELTAEQEGVLLAARDIVDEFVHRLCRERSDLGSCLQATLEPPLALRTGASLGLEDKQALVHQIAASLNKYHKWIMLLTCVVFVEVLTPLQLARCALHAHPLMPSALIFIHAMETNMRARAAPTPPTASASPPPTPTPIPTGPTLVLPTPPHPAPEPSAPPPAPEPHPLLDPMSLLHPPPTSAAPSPMSSLPDLPDLPMLLPDDGPPFCIPPLFPQLPPDDTPAPQPTLPAAPSAGGRSAEEVLALCRGLLQQHPDSEPLQQLSRLLAAPAMGASAACPLGPTTTPLGHTTPGPLHLCLDTTTPSSAATTTTTTGSNSSHFCCGDTLMHDLPSPQHQQHHSGSPLGSSPLASSPQHHQQQQQPCLSTASTGMAAAFPQPQPLSLLTHTDFPLQGVQQQQPPPQQFMQLHQHSQPQPQQQQVQQPQQVSLQALLAAAACTQPLQQQPQPQQQLLLPDMGLWQQAALLQQLLLPTQPRPTSTDAQLQVLQQVLPHASLLHNLL